MGNRFYTFGFWNRPSNRSISRLLEKNKRTVCIPFYEDNSQTLSSIASSFFKEKKIPISQQAINLLSDRCRGDRQNLNNELNKIDNFIIKKKKINLDDILKLTNLAENYNVSELIDNCLAKNKSKTVNILNENIYNVEDCIIIIRTFLIKAKRLLTIVNHYVPRKYQPTPDATPYADNSKTPQNVF